MLILLRRKAKKELHSGDAMKRAMSRCIRVPSWSTFCQVRRSLTRGRFSKKQESSRVVSFNEPIKSNQSKRLHSVSLMLSSFGFNNGALSFIFSFFVFFCEILYFNEKITSCDLRKQTSFVRSFVWIETTYWMMLRSKCVFLIVNE